MFHWISCLFAKKPNNNKKDELNSMATKILKMPRAKISSAAFCKNHMTVGAIKRTGKNIVIVDANGTLMPISRKNVEDLRATAIRNNQSAIIRTSGLSRAQVGRIVGDLKEGAGVNVFVRKAASPSSRKPQATNFEILLMDEKNDEG